LVLVAFVLLAIFLVVTARLFVWPPSDRPTRADAIVALGGDPGQLRAKKAVQLARSGYASIVVVSLGGNGARCPVAPSKVRVDCFHANPLDTRGEAEFVARLARRDHWRRIIVVPERSQTTRARLLFERCTNASLEMVPVADHGLQLVVDVAYEWGALGKALVWKTSC
jgi:uncharacterized SAM-binding protein YcdF (DUF218 family)